ncbi:unnamed protein product [Camellia sinensis]|uniref:Homeobox domain-containing protein n=1 Tax=Camellia sinensis var. sinensis TaxID=542762 RepID=A0A4S4ETH2_CAMSN|nr:homeobox-leucine zipper protein HOX11-like [Camellia sinensis]THG20193.1 hypothetical protein TEA_005578 [Camellia sinensis var. sinensis]
MELGLSLGDAHYAPNSFSLLGPLDRSKDKGEEQRRGSSSSSDSQPVQLDLLPFTPVPRNQPTSQFRFPWLTENLLSEPGSSDGSRRRIDRVNRLPLAVEDGEDGGSLSSPNSTVSSFQMEDLSIYTSGRVKRDLETTILNEFDKDHQRGGSSRGSDEEENGLARKKLRLSKEQSAFLEHSFKDHNTLNPKQKLALAKQLNLRPRQVEVWFQNRRARTKLKQTEVDCEYLKRCFEALTEENRRLQKELQELRTLKASQSFYKQPPATTLTMCPSCERVASTTTTTTTVANPTTTGSAATATANNTVYPFISSQSHAQEAA